MKLTKTKLKQLIKEELDYVLDEVEDVLKVPQEGDHSAAYKEDPRLRILIDLYEKGRQDREIALHWLDTAAETYRMMCDEYHDKESCKHYKEILADIKRLRQNVMNDAEQKTVLGGLFSLKRR